MRKRWISLLCSAAIAASLLTGCSGSSSETEGSTGAAETAEEESASEEETASEETEEETDYSDIVVTYALASTWDTLFPWSSSSSYYTGLPIDKIFDSLICSELDGTSSPRAASSWEMSDDGMTVTMYLNEDSYWHDGEKVTTQDWIWTFETIGDEGVVGATNKSSLSVLRGFDSSGNRDESEEIGVEAPDDYTLVFYLDSPTSLSTFMSSAGQWKVMPRHLLEDIAPADLMTDSFWTSPIGSGPCYFISEVSGQEMTLGSFQDYYLGAPKFGQLVYRVIASSNMATSMMAGEIDACYPNISVDEALELEGTEGININKTTEVTALMFVTIDNQTYDANVRQAINLAIDKQLLVDQLLQGEGEVAVSHAVPGSSGDVSGLTYEGRDVERAKELLEEAGWVEGTTITCAVPSGIREKIASIMQQNLEEIGIDLEIVTVDAATMFSGIRDGTYGMGIITVNMSANPTATMKYLLNPDYMPYNRITDYTFYEMMSEIETMNDEEEIAEALKELYLLMDEEQPFILLYHEYIFSMTSDRVSGMSLVGYDKVWEWEIAQ